LWLFISGQETNKRAKSGAFALGFEQEFVQGFAANRPIVRSLLEPNRSRRLKSGFQSLRIAFLEHGEQARANEPIVRTRRLSAQRIEQ